MQLRRAVPTILAVLMAFAAPGCGFPGLGGGGATRPGGAGVSGAPDGTGGADDISAFSPEVSMQRDLLQLREREAGQRETVENMRLALRQGGEDMQREEERLRDIQMQIERYDSAMRRYEMAGRYAVPADGRGGETGALPVRYSPAGRGGANYRYDDYSGDSGYAALSSRPRAEEGQRGREGDLSRFGGQAGANGMPGGMQGMPRAADDRAGSAPARGGEEVLYAGAYDPRLAEQPAPVGDLTLRRATGRVPVQRRPMFEDDAAEAGFFAAPDAGEFAQRDGAESVWNRPSVPAPARKALPAGQRETLAAKPVAPAPVPEARPVLPEEDGMEEVFTPDLFLSRR